jgi:hypothetical protein
MYPWPNREAALPNAPRHRIESVDPRFKTSSVEQPIPDDPPTVSLLRKEILEPTFIESRTDKAVPILTPHATDITPLEQVAKARKLKVEPNASVSIHENEHCLNLLT